MRGLALLLFCFSLSSAAALEGVKFSALKGREVVSRFRGRSLVARSKLDCLRSLCAGHLASCAVFFNKGTGECLSATVTASCLASAVNTFSTISSNQHWSAIIRSEEVDLSPKINFGSSLEAPSALWMMDAENRGRNLGSKGRLLDMQETGLTAWNIIGPRGTASSKTFVKMDASNAATIRLLHCGEHLVKFTGLFSVGLWVKTDDKESKMAILEWKSGVGVDLWFTPSYYQDQLELFLKPGHEYNSVKNATGRLSWRHVAAVYGGVGDVRFYFNGYSVGVSVKSTIYTQVDQPDEFTLGRYHSYSSIKHRFYRSMACLSIYERALTQAEVKILMNSCP